jgi:hypothetical protein
VAGEESARPRCEKGSLRDCARRPERGAKASQRRGRAEPQSERAQPAQRDRVRAEHDALDLPPGGDQGLDQRRVRVPVDPEGGSSVLDAALERERASVVEGVSSRGRRVDPVHFQAELPEDGRLDTERVNRRADVVDEARQSQLRAPHASADRLLGLEEVDVVARLREDDRAGQPVRAGADHRCGLHRRARKAGPSVWPPRRTGSKRSPCSSTRSRVCRMPTSRGRTFSPSSSHRSGVDTGAPGFGRTE